jgi:hypothetical protein
MVRGSTPSHPISPSIHPSDHPFAFSARNNMSKCSYRTPSLSAHQTLERDASASRIRGPFRISLWTCAQDLASACSCSHLHRFLLFTRFAKRPALTKDLTWKQNKSLISLTTGADSTGNKHGNPTPKYRIIVTVSVNTVLMNNPMKNARIIQIRIQSYCYRASYRTEKKWECSATCYGI